MTFPRRGIREGSSFAANRQELRKTDRAGQQGKQEADEGGKLLPVQEWGQRKGIWLMVVFQVKRLTGSTLEFTGKQRPPAHQQAHGEQQGEQGQQQHQLIQQQVAQVNHDQDPTVRGKQSRSRGQVIAVGAQVVDRFGFFVIDSGFVRLSRTGREPAVRLGLLDVAGPKL